MSIPFRSRRSVGAVVAGLRDDEHAPFSAMIEIADRCNETCVHCYQIQGQKGELDTDDWRTILDELADLGVVFLTISGGEATLRKDFLELVAYARKKRFAIKVYTNGLTMTEGLANRLGELAVQEVQISLYSHRAEAHDAVTCVPGSWAKTVAGARYLIAAGVAVVLKSPMMKMNADEIDEYIDFVVSVGADYAMDPTLDPRENGDREPETMRIDDRQYLAAMSNPRIVDASFPSPPPVRDLSTSVCGACSGNVHIEANGTMHPCTMLQVPVGNALTDGVGTAWRTNEAGKAIRGLTWRDLPGCAGCDLSPYCSRCFATAKIEVGDALAPYASACARTLLSYERLTGNAARVEGSGETGPYRRVRPHVFRPVPAPAETGARPVGMQWSREDAPLVQLRTRRVADRQRNARPIDRTPSDRHNAGGLGFEGTSPPTRE